jgi:hypothetical protein
MDQACPGIRVSDANNQRRNFPQYNPCNTNLRRVLMTNFSRLFLLSVWLFMAGNAAAQQTQGAPLKGLQINKINPAVAPPRLAPGVLVMDPEAQVQAEIKREQKKRDQINAALAKVGANYSKLTYTPVTGNSCVDPDTTWNARSGETFTCSGMTTCIGRSSRWSKNRTNPCEPGVTIDSCVISDECKSGSTCDTGRKMCVRTQ